MSYESFKEFYLSCPVQRCSVAGKGESLLSQHRLSNCSSSSLGATDGEERKPPKTSLKEKVAALVAWPDRDRNKVLPYRSRTTTSPLIPPESETNIHLEEGNGSGKKRFESSNEAGLHPKWAEEDSGRLDESRIGTSGASSSSYILNPNKRRRHGSSLLSTDDLQRKNFSPNVTISVEEVDEREGEERSPTSEPEDGEELGLDSEAGFSTEPLLEGPFEPLQLWPRAGAGTSDHVEEETVIQVPASINSRLLEHQREGVVFLYDLYREDRGGILGDDMGLGKTIQTIAFLAAILRKEKESLLSSMSTKVGVQKQKCEKVALILCPTSVVRNWEQEFRAWGEFQVGVCHGLQRGTVLARVVAKEVEIVLTSHDTFRIYGNEFCKLQWDCVVVDEAHRLKNHKSQFYIMCLKLPTMRRYGLTGTVMQNKYMELFNVFDWATPGCLGTRDHFREYYSGPIAEGQRISAPQRFVTIAEDRKKHLHLRLDKYLKRRTKSETIGHLMKGKEDIIVFCPMSSVQKSVFRRVLQSPDYEALTKNGLPCSCGSPLTRAECCYRTVPNGFLWPALHKDSLDSGRDCCPYCLVLPCLTKLRMLSNHFELIKPNPKDDPEKQDKDYMFARMAFGEDANVVGGIEQEQSFLGLSDSQHCGKMAVLEKLLASWITRGDKVLLFSGFVRMLDILEKFLIRKGYCFSRLDGSIPMNSRQALVEDFNHSPSKQIFIITTRAGGLGLNLTSANRVVIFDPDWNPAHDLQAQDRSFRFGQNRHVTVFRLLAAGTVEELIYTRQIYKQQLSNIAMSGADEKRYFEGVQGSKQHKGELFGLSNLFRDMSEDLFAEEIIENHEERLIRVQQLAAVEDETLPIEHIGAKDSDDEFDHSGYVTCDETDNSGSPQVATEERDQGDDVEDSRSNQKALTKAGFRIGRLEALVNGQKTFTKLPVTDVSPGVLYFHRNEDVVNMRPPAPEVQKRAKCPTHLENRSNGQEKKVDAKFSHRQQNRNVGQSQKIRPPEDTGPVKAKHPITNSPTKSTRQVPGNDGRSFLAQLAEFKGTDISEFSKWYVSATPEERTQLRVERRNSLASSSS